MGAGIALASIGMKNEALSVFFELVDIFAKSRATVRSRLSWCKVSSCDLFLKSGNARIALARFTLLNDASRRTLSFLIFHMVPRALGELDGVS